MDDPEDGLIDSGKIEVLSRPSIPIFNHFIKFRLIGQLTLFNWKKYCIVAWIIQAMFFISITTMVKPEWNATIYTIIILTLCIPLVGYAAVLLNMFNGGWGQEESRFWCHVRIMFMHGYNTLRWTISSSIDPLIVICLTQIYQCNIICSCWSAVNILYAYFIMANIEISKAVAFNVHEKFSNDFDVDLKRVHDIQGRNTTAVDINGFVIIIIGIIPWAFLGYVSSYIFIVYQLLLMVNELSYANGKQTFVQTEIQFDIIQIIFRTILIWILLWV